MILDTFEKQPRERKDYDVDFSPWLPLDDSLDEVVVIVECLTDPSDTSLVCEPDPPITVSAVKLWMNGGTDGNKYKATLLTTTVIGRLDESEVIFKVVNR